MAKKEYKLNPQTLTYEVVAAPFRLRFYRFLRKLLIGFILASIVNFFFSFFFYTPKMYRIRNENSELLIKYDILRDKIRSSTKKLQEIKHRDQNVYRSLFGTDTLNIPGIYNHYPDDKYNSMSKDRYATLMTGTWKELDAMTRMVYLESISFDDLQALSKDKEQMATAIPAIWPIDKRTLRGHIGAFGGRNHPILKTYMMHKGIDLGSNTGTPIYATGNGVVIKDWGAGTGYGKQVLIDHGFGYMTRYAHMHNIYVVQGQKVVRGEIIGEVGSTGRSSGPHLHYEVIYRGVAVDPINYFRRDMDEGEFERIIQLARETTYETDE